MAVGGEWAVPIGTVIGGVLALLGGILAPALNSWRDRRHRREDHLREILYQLQEQLVEAQIAASKVHHRYGEKFSAGGEWGYKKPNEQWDWGHLEPMNRVVVLMARIPPNPPLMEQVSAARDAVGAIAEARSQEVSKAALHQLDEATAAANGIIHHLLYA